MKRMVTITVVIALLCLLVYFASNLLKKLLAPAPTLNQASLAYKSEDINKDGQVDQADEEIVKKQFGCRPNQSCWSKVIGKTLSGDNPIYTSDLDLNKDGNIDLLDIQLMKNAE